MYAALQDFSLSPIDPIIKISFIFSWTGILLGFFSGAIMGLFFYKASWLGGYDSFQRRMLRLGHISFFGLAFIQLLFTVTVIVSGLQPVCYQMSLIFFFIGSATMPCICFLSSWKSGFRHMFFIPVSALIIALLLFFWRIVHV